MKMGELLSRMRGPEDLRALDHEQMVRLASEIRHAILETVSRNGGHLAPSLGVVELTLALHSVFESPRDKILWDVGHQSYAHKLITGRRDRFDTLRTLGGISGFPKTTESPHDVFDTGHSSTAISAALGLAKARDLAGQDHAVVAVVGDGSLTGGMAFEALNHAGQDGTRIIIVLNDNEMSIARNVGALSSYLSRLRTDPRYSRVKADIEHVLQRIPGIGGTVFKAAERLKDSVKYLLVEGVIFEELGFRYLGPIDGHNIPLMQSIFASAKAIRGPVLVHVVTRKGKGYTPAEKDPNRYHGIGKFHLDSGEPVGGPRSTYSEAFGEALGQLASTDERIVAITAAMSDGTGLANFARKFPSRFFDVGIAEQHAVTFAAGLARGGLRPVVAIYSTFLQRAYDQVIHDVANQRLPVVFAIDRAGVVGEDGETHQGLFDIAYLRAVPNMVLMAPKDGAELRLMLEWALAQEGPVALRYPRAEVEHSPARPSPLEAGRAELMAEGDHVAILAVGPMVYAAVRAAELLKRSGIRAAVINARFLKPIDSGLIAEYARRTRRILTVEEHSLEGGFGSAVLECLNDEGLETVQVCRIGLPPGFLPHGPRSHFLDAYGLSPDGICLKARALASRRGLHGLKERRRAAGDAGRKGGESS